jgi:Pyruvate/2-oxoacid:ferredoxin oxidoreductase gamma subunit
VSGRAIDSPLVSRPNVLLAMNEPSLRKFLPSVETDGVVLYNGPALPEECARSDVRMVAKPFTQLADELGSSKVGNIVMLGALLEATSVLDEEQVTAAMRRLVKSDRWFDLDVVALERGREEIRKSGESLAPVGEDYLWGV